MFTMLEYFSFYKKKKKKKKKKLVREGNVHFLNLCLAYILDNIVFQYFSC